MASRALLHDPDFAQSPAMHFASLEPVRLGMPELCRAGLSENWLWKACGHRHWLALARAHGMERPDFRTATGTRLYPAFVRTELCDGRLDEVGEDDSLKFALRLERCGQTRFASDIAVTLGDRHIATVRMESVFLCRTIAGANLSAARAVVAAPCALPPPPVRRTRIDAEPYEPGTVSHRHIVDPNPWEDFNGADFLYFASFQAIIDRAEWGWSGREGPLLVTRRRDIRFFGNIELGDRVAVMILDAVRQGGELTHLTELRRVSDAQLIAVSRTHRVAVPGHRQ